jgi:hypothetical protein
MMDFQQLWQQLWVAQEDLFSERDVHRDSNPVEGVEVPEKYQALCGLPRVLRAKPVLIREEYPWAENAIIDYQKENNVVVVVGHSGIGMAPPISD